MINKIPKIWLSYNKILIQSYLQEFSRQDYLSFSKSKKVKEINDFIKKYRDNLLENISKLSGIPWFRKEIPVYLVPSKKIKSFSHPLVLSLKNRDTKVELLILAHEFCHINLIADRDFLFFNNAKTKRIDFNDEVFCWVVAKIAIQKTISNTLKFKKAWNEILSWPGMEETKQEIEKLEKEWDYNKINFLNYYKKFIKNK